MNVLVVVKGDAMSSSRKWLLCSAAGALLLIYLVVGGGHAGERQDKAQIASSAKLRELLKERYEILKTLVEAEKHLMDIGQGSRGGIAAATVAMLRAEADLRSTNSQRIEIHEKIVTILRENEAAIAREADRSLASAADVAKVRLARIKAQIRIEKMKLAQQASP